jgi:hypothetical protein
MAQRAVRTKSKIRLAISGPSGSGKTYSSLAIATECLSILKENGYSFGNDRIGMLETERGRANNFAKIEDDDTEGFDFDIEILRDYSPEAYIEGLLRLEQERYPIIIIDQITNEWAAKGGVLDIHLRTVAKMGGEKHNYFAWRECTPRHVNFVEFMMGLNAHLICNIRAKTKYVYESGKIENIGTRPIQRKDLDYEFDIYGMMDMKHNIKFRKSRCPALDGKTFELPGKNVAELMMAWALRGTGQPKTPEGNLPEKYVHEINRLWKELGHTVAQLSPNIKKRGVESGRVEDLSVNQAMEIIETLKAKMVGTESNGVVSDAS